MSSNDAMLTEMPNMLNGYFGRIGEVSDQNVVSLAFELALEEEMAAMLRMPSEVSIK